MSSTKTPQNNPPPNAENPKPPALPTKPTEPEPPGNPVSRMKRRVSKFRIPKTVYAFEKKATTWYWEPMGLRVCVIVLLLAVGTLLVLGLSCSEWFIALASGYHQGLFVYCIDENATNLPTNSVPSLNETEGCHWIEMSFQDYSTWAFVAGWISLFVCILGTIVLVLMYANKELLSKFYLSLAAALLLLLAVLVGAAALAMAFLEFIVISENESLDWTYGSAFWVTCTGVALLLILTLFVLWTCCCISRELKPESPGPPPSSPTKLNVTSLSTTHSTAFKQDGKSNYVATSTKIGKNVTIGEKCVICPGVTIGDNVIIGAGSVVAADIPSNSIVGGDPATIVPYSDNQKIFVQS